MSPEQELVCQWLKHAKSDLANAEYDLTAQSPFIEDSCFRYPYPGPALTVEQAYEAIAIARKVWGFVIPWFPKEIVP